MFFVLFSLYKKLLGVVLFIWIDKVYDSLMVGSEAAQYFYKKMAIEYVCKGVWHDVNSDMIKLFEIDLYIFRLKKALYE